MDSCDAFGRSFVAAPSGLYLPERIATRHYQPPPVVTGVDVFAGAGGFSCGAMQAGMQVVAAVEYDCIAAMTYMTNLCRWGEVQLHFVEPEDRIRMDEALRSEYRRSGITITKDGQIRLDGKVSWKRVPIAGSGWIAHEPDLVAVKHMVIGDVRKLTGDRLLQIIGMAPGELGCMFGGPPCQGFSTSGKRNVMDPRNSLVFDYARLICEMKPKTMVMENVLGILTMVTPDGVPVVDAFTRILEDGGFGEYETLLKTVKAQTGAVGLLRGKPKPRRKRRKEAADDCKAV